MPKIFRNFIHEYLSPVGYGIYYGFGSSYSLSIYKTFSLIFAYTLGTRPIRNIPELSKLRQFVIFLIGYLK